MNTAQAVMDPGDGDRDFNRHPVKPPPRQEQPLTPTTVQSDLCDATCPQVALYRLTRKQLELLLCGHHYDVHEPALAAGGWSPLQIRERPS